MKKMLLLSLVLITMTACSTGKVKSSAEENAATPVAAACPVGCYLTECAGALVCVKNKPAPLCTPCT